MLFMIILFFKKKKRIYTYRLSASSFLHHRNLERHAQLITYLPSWWQNCIPQFPRSLKEHRRIRSQLPDASVRTLPSPGSLRWEDNAEKKPPGSGEAKGRPWMLLCLHHLQDHRRMLREREDEPRSAPAQPIAPAPHLFTCALAPDTHNRAPPTPGTHQPISHFPHTPPPLSPHASPRSFLLTHFPSR